MRTYHALYKPAGRKNPRRTRSAAKRRPDQIRRQTVGLRRARSNPASSADVALTVSKEVEKDLKKIFKGKSGLYEPAPLAPAGVIMIAPGDDVEFGNRIYKGLKSEWKWVALTNGGALISEGKEKEPNAAIVEATASLMTWALPLIATMHTRLQEEGKTEEQLLKAMKKFNVREYTPDGSKMPKSGKSKKLKGPSRMTAKIYGEKPKKAQARAGEVIWYVEVFDDDGKPIGGGDQKHGRIGPILDGAAAYGIVNSLWGLVQGEEDAVEANPVQRNRLKSKARRNLARKNDGIWDLLKTPRVEEPKGPVGGDEMSKLAFDSSIGVPGDPIAAMQIGYYRGILRGMNSCKWYPDPMGVFNRWLFRKEMDKKLVDAYNSLSQDIATYTPAVRPAARRIMR